MQQTSFTTLQQAKEAAQNKLCGYTYTRHFCDKITDLHCIYNTSVGLSITIWSSYDMGQKFDLHITDTRVVLPAIPDSPTHVRRSLIDRVLTAIEESPGIKRAAIYDKLHLFSKRDYNKANGPIHKLLKRGIINRTGMGSNATYIIVSYGK